MKGRIRSGVFLGVTALAAAVGCRQEMYDQPKYQPLQKSGFFADGRASRPLVEGTVARGMLTSGTAAVPPGAAPMASTELVTTLPVPLTRELVARGHERFGIFCTPCHDRTGSGTGMVVRRGYRQPPSLHIDRLRDAPIGHFYDVMTRGLGAMPDYAQQIPPADRWAIAAYVKALQLSQRATVAELPVEDRARLEAGSRETGDGKRGTKEPGH
ncbi:MAG TPA: cytochrome c [Thermoanaerobaculia bacterium]